MIRDNNVLKLKIKFYSIVAAVFLIIIFLLICFYQIKQYDRRPAFNAIEGIVAIRRIEKNDLDYIKIKDNLYLCKEDKGAKLLTNEFASFKSHVDVTDHSNSYNGSIFKDTIVITKNGKKMITNAGQFDVLEGRFYFVGLKEAE